MATTNAFKFVNLVWPSTTNNCYDDSDGDFTTITPVQLNTVAFIKFHQNGADPLLFAIL